MKFKVGDKVRILDANVIVSNRFNLTTGKEYEVLSFHEKSNTEVEHIKVADNHSNPFTICDWEYKYIELVTQKVTKNQRITALEETVTKQGEEIAELKVIVHELRKPSTVVTGVSASSVEDIIEFEGKQYRKVDRLAREGDVVVFKDGAFGKSASFQYEFEKNEPYEVLSDVRLYNEFCVYESMYNRTPETVDVYEPITQDVQHQKVECTAAKTANELRAEIIEKAKAFIDENGGDDYHFEIDEKERQILAWKVVKRGAKTGLSTCHPNDVFNVDIGRAIAFGRAENLDVSEFEQAVQPTEVVAGMKIRRRYFESADFYEKQVAETDGKYMKYTDEDHDLSIAPEDDLTIINDTNVIYSEVNE